MCRNYLLYKIRLIQIDALDPTTPGTGAVDLPFGYWPYARDFFPFSFAVEDQHLHALWDADSLLAWDDGVGRDVPVFSSLRFHVKTFTGARANVTRWLQEMDIEGAVVGSVDEGTRSKGGKQYWDYLRRAKIVATANPGGWEGDFRLWEALASKGLVFVDELHAPMPCPLLHGEDVIYYDAYDRRSFEQKVRYYLAHPEEARRIAMSGFHKVIRCHRWVNRVDYIMSTAAHLLDPGFKVRIESSACRASVHHLTIHHDVIKIPPTTQESGIYLKETMMRTSAREFYAVTKKGALAEPVAAAAPAATERSGAGEGHGGYVEGAVAPLSIETYRSRVAAKVRTFDDEYWAMSEAWNRSRSVGAAEAAGRR